MSDHGQLRSRGRLSVVCAATAAVTAVACCLALPAGASASAAGAAARAARAPAAHAVATGAVSPTPVSGTPTLVATGTTTETVRQLVQCGGTMYAVGSFTQIKGSNGTFTRNNIFSFSATTPFAVTSWNPNVNGEVNTIAFNGGNCADAYIGGQFTSVGGAAAANIAEVSASTGAVVPGFGSNTGGGHVDTILAVNGHLLVGGTFTGINGSSADPYYASLNPTTGKDDGFLHLNISGNYVYPKVFTNSTEVYNQQLSHGGTLDLVEGDFTSVGGLHRQQIFMLNVGGSTATVTGWSSPEFDGSKGNLPSGYPYQCADSHPVYIRAAAWSPDDKTIYIADTGVRPWNWNGKFPIPGLCDAAAAFPASPQAEVTHNWVISTGCDSLYSVAADSFAVYVGGHQRWMPNANACNAQGPGSIPDQGLAGIAPGPLGGTLMTNSSGTAGLYSRSRGHGADDMLLTSAGLWIASDNFGGNTSCGGVRGFSGICFLAYG
jgi:hypothetical protein